jgi:hypothetical protein
MLESSFLFLIMNVFISPFNKIVTSSLPIALIASITYLAVKEISNLSP